MNPITILVAALGGQGGGVLAEWLVEVATRAGHPVQSTSIPGVAQRTGATTYYVEVYPEPHAALGGRRPLLSLLPVHGCIDLLVASELLEAARMVQNGMASAARTVLVASSSRTLTTQEKMPLGDGRFEHGRLTDALARHSRHHVSFDMERAAREAGTAVSAVMLGAIAATGVLPFARDDFEAAIRESGRGVDASLAGFARGWDAVAARSTGDTGSAVPPSSASAAASVPHAPAVVATLPPEVHDFAGEGHRRLAQYQDAAYAALYLERLARIRAAEERADASHAHGYATTRETARFLALWMAFDDIVRVADLKSRASRFERVRGEVRAGEGDVVRIVDYFKPGAAEFAALLPPRLARGLVAWDRRRQARGKAPLELALAVRTSTITGLAALRVLASLRGMRRRGARYAQEQALIERWLAAVEGALAEDWSFGHEIALAGRLVKGYGATNERGKANLLHILEHLAAARSGASPAQRVEAVRAARTAALADEDGRALDTELAARGAPPRPVPAQPIRWMKRPPAAQAHPR